MLPFTLRRVVFAVPVLALAATLPAQEAAPKKAVSELDPMHWGVVVDVPATKQVKLRADVVYRRRGNRDLSVDIYQPPDLKAGQVRPAVVFVNAVGDRGDDRVKRWGIYRTWPRLVAAHGLCGVSMDADSAAIPECLQAVFEFLATQGKPHGIDGNQLGVYAASANVGAAGTYLLGKTAHPGIRAAALVYGGPPKGELRKDLPVLFVIPESDAERMREPLAELWTRVLEQRAPWTLCHGSDLPHAFDAFTETPAARALVMQVLAFWQHQLTPPAATSVPSPTRAIIAAQYGNKGEHAVKLLDEYLVQQPKDTIAHTARASMLQRLGRYREAGDAFARAIELGTKDPGPFAGLGMVRLGERKYGEAESLFQSAFDLGATDGYVLGQLAYSQLFTGKNKAAVANYEKAFSLGIPEWAQKAGIARYNLACGYARLGEKDKAIASLEQAITAGFKDKKQFESDDDLKPLRDDARFQTLLGGL
jgi:Flp pilus assembly protein TadD